MIRAVVHAGFHKTATTSVQRFFQDNETVLSPFVRLGLNYKLRAVIEAARGYSRWREPLGLAQFEARLKAFLRERPLGSGQKLVFSVEEFAGLLPGLPGRPDQPEIRDYGAAPMLAHTVRDLIAADLGAGNEVVFYYSTRDSQDWLSSTYWQHVRTQKMQAELHQFCESYRPAADLGAVVAAVARALPETRIVCRALEDLDGLRFGPATPILDLLDLPREVLDQLTPIKPANLTPPEQVLDAMLSLNRGPLNGAELREAKQALIALDAAEALDPGASGREVEASLTQQTPRKTAR